MELLLEPSSGPQSWRVADTAAASFGDKFPTPWAHQQRTHLELRERFRRGDRKIIVASPTGSGKTLMGLRVITEAVNRGRRAVFVCDRVTLINQTSARADSYGMDHGIIQAEHWRRNSVAPFQIASVQTIQKRDYWPRADIFVIDEAHTVHTAVRRLIERATSDMVIVGLTATPCTTGLGELYQSVVNSATADELTRNGVLVPLRILTCIAPDMKGAATSAGEWTAKAAAERELTILGDVVCEWEKHGEGRKTIAFGPNIAYCESLAQRFNASGVAAATFTSDTPDNEREELLAEFEKPDSLIRVLVSVEALAKGFDVKDIGCVIDARPLRKSLSTFIQMLGRGLRASPETGKHDCILLDHSGNVRRFYDDFVDVYFNGFGALDDASKQDQKVREEADDFVPSGCPQCHKKPFRKRCLACGYEKPSHSLVDESPGEMVEVRIGKRIVASDKRNLFDQLCTYAKDHLRSDAKKYGWVWHKYQEFTGERLPSGWSYDSAPRVEVSPGTIGKLKQLQIRWGRRKG